MSDPLIINSNQSLFLNTLETYLDQAFSWGTTDNAVLYPPTRGRFVVPFNQYRNDSIMLGTQPLVPSYPPFDTLTPTFRDIAKASSLALAAAFAQAVSSAAESASISLLNGVTNWGDTANYEELKAERNCLNEVYLSGIIKIGSNITPATPLMLLPVGFRPSKNIIVPVVHQGAFNRIEIQQNGFVLIGLSATAGDWIFIQTSFKVAQ